MSSYRVHLALVPILKTGGLLGVKTPSLTPIVSETGGKEKKVGKRGKGGEREERGGKRVKG